MRTKILTLVMIITISQLYSQTSNSISHNDFKFMDSTGKIDLKMIESYYSQVTNEKFLLKRIDIEMDNGKVIDGFFLALEGIEIHILTNNDVFKIQVIDISKIILYDVKDNSLSTSIGVATGYVSSTIISGIDEDFYLTNDNTALILPVGLLSGFLAGLITHLIYEDNFEFDFSDDINRKIVELKSFKNYINGIRESKLSIKTNFGLASRRFPEEFTDGTNTINFDQSSYPSLNLTLLHKLAVMIKINDVCNIGIMTINSSDQKHKYLGDPTTFQINEYQICNNGLSFYIFSEFISILDPIIINLGGGLGFTSLEFIIKDPYTYGQYAFEIKNRKTYFSSNASIDFLLRINKFTDFGIYLDYVYTLGEYEFPSYERKIGFRNIMYPSLKVPLSFYSYGFVLGFNF